MGSREEASAVIVKRTPCIQGVCAGGGQDRHSVCVSSPFLALQLPPGLEKAVGSMMRGEVATVWAWEDPLAYKEGVLMGGLPGPLKVPLPPVAGPVEYSVQLEHIIQVQSGVSVRTRSRPHTPPVPSSYSAFRLRRSPPCLVPVECPVEYWVQLEHIIQVQSGAGVKTTYTTSPAAGAHRPGTVWSAASRYSLGLE